MLPIPNLGPKRNLILPARIRYKRLRSGCYAKVHRRYSDGSIEIDGWMGCREQFQDVSQGIRWMLLTHPKGKTRAIAAFIHRIESKLNIPLRTRIGPTQFGNVSWLWVSPWWSCSSMRRSLFTILLRSAPAYKPTQDNWEQALLADRYARETEYAVRRFMAGYTKYTGKTRGWWSQFRWGAGNAYHRQRPTPDQVNRLLVK